MGRCCDSFRQALGDIERAIADYSRAIRLDPSDADFYQNRGNAWRLKGDNKRALADQQRTMRLRTSAGR